MSSTLHKNCLLLVTDQEYLKYFYPLMKSIRETDENVKNIFFRIHLINVDSSELATIDRVTSGMKCFITKETIELSSEKTKTTLYPEMPLLHDKLISDKQAYANNKRYELLNSVLGGEYFSNVLYMDVDHIVRGDLSELFEIISHHDITIHKYPPEVHPIAWRHFLTYCCGMFGVSCNDKTFKFFNELWEVTSKRMTDIADQADFHTILKVHKPNLSIGQLPQKFKDDRFDVESVVWTGDGCKKFDNEYIEESKLHGDS